MRTGREALGRLLESLAPEAPHEVIVVDNGGDAEAPEGVTLLPPQENLGYGGGNNLGARHATGDALVFLNPDTVVTPGALAGLVEPLEDRSVGIVTARLRLLDRPETLNSAGNEVHVTGIAWAGAYGEPADSVAEPQGCAPSGAAMAIRRELFESSAASRELFLYQGDLILGRRVRLRGLRVVVSPAADVLHEYEFGCNPRTTSSSGTGSCLCSRRSLRSCWCSWRRCWFPSRSGCWHSRSRRAGRGTRCAAGGG